MPLQSLRHAFGKLINRKSKPIRKSTTRLHLELLEDRTAPAVYAVTSTAGSGVGSLRQAILDANANAGADVIQFNIPATDAGHVYYKNDGVAGRLLPQNVVATTASNDSSIADIDPDWTHSWYQIKPTSALPTITGPVTIDGYTQPGSSPNSSPGADNAVLRIELNGASAGTTSNGLWITAGNSTVKGLVINRFKANGIRLDSGDNNMIVGNFIGPDVSGSVSIPQRSQLIGVEIVNGSSGNILGTDGDGSNDFAERNVLSAALKANVFISGTGADNNAIAGNLIGLNAAGDGWFSNPGITSGVGVWIEGGAQHNLIGSDGDGVADDAERNAISRNGGTITTGPSSLGVYIAGASTTDNVVAGNFIDANSKGGVKLKDTTNNRIGSNGDGIGDAAERNVIARSSGGAGIELENSTHIQIAGNDIQSSGYGVKVVGSSHNTMGGTTPGARNVIFDNNIAGIYITDSTTAASHNVIMGNFIGTDATGTTAIRNETGVKILNAQHNLVGGTAPGAGNVISGNLHGIVIEDQGTTAIEGFNVVEGNIIGLDASGTFFVSNGYEGIKIVESDMNRIGGTAPGARNIISGNGQRAIHILGGDPSITTGNVIQGNWLGLDSAGNGLFNSIIESTVLIGHANNTLVGGVTPGAGNTSAYAGILVGGGAHNTVIQGNAIGQTAHGAPAPWLVGVSVAQSSWNTLVGGTEPGAGNIIVAAGGSGSAGVVGGGDVYPAKWWRAEQSGVESITESASVAATLHGGTSFAQGKYGYAFQFDGVDDYVEVPDVGIDFGSESGIEAWVRPNSVDHVQQMLSKFGPGGNAYQIGLTATGALQAQVFVAGVVHTLQSAPGALSAGEWANVGLARDSSGYTLYLNGVAVDSIVLGVISATNTTPLSFGRKSDGTEYFDGLIDEVAFYGPNALFPLRYLTGGVNKWDSTAIRGNSITITAGKALGIELGPFLGLNITDPGDADIGANDNQNAPEILAATSDGTQVTVQGVLHSMPFATYDIEFFANSAPPHTPTAIDGEQFIGFGTVVTDATGTANFEFTFDVAVPVDYLMSATATAMSDHDSNPDTPLESIATSEFSGLKVVAPKAGGRIQGVKFSDENANGQWDSGEPGLPGWTIYLDANNNGVLDNNEQWRGTLTSGYSFTNLQAGTYYVREVQQTGWTQTTPAVVEVVVTNPQSRPIYVVNIGNHQAQSLVSGVKFHDVDGDGVRDAGEPGLANWTIYIDENGNGQPNAGEPATGSDVNGVWGFENLPAGTYHFREVQKAGWVQTTANPLTVTLTADGQSADAGVIGNYQLATISGAKFNDRNADGVHQPNESGISGWTIYIDANDNGVLDDGELSDTTGFQGAYSFTGLTAGTYRIREVQQPDWEQTTANVDVEVLLNLSGQEYTVLVGNFRPSSIIGGVKFEDINGNGARDAGEPGIAHWTISLDVDGDGTADRFTGTNANGEYSFSGLPTGIYRVREVQEPGWVQTTDDPDDIVIDEGGQIITGPSFGNYRLATISGVKFDDCNKNGLPDAGENGLEGWTIFLDGNDNGLLDEGEQSAVTNLDGGYSFDNLIEGDYRVREVQQPGWVQTTPDVTTLVLPNVSAQAYAVNIGNALDHPHDGICVINTNDSGPGSLRQAILDANANPGPDFICFNIPVTDPGHVYYQDDGIAGKVTEANVIVTSATDDSTIADIDPDHPYSFFRIKPMTVLPISTGPVTIDGYTQSGASVNTLPNGDNRVLRIDLDGSAATGSSFIDALKFTGGNSTVRGLAIHSFTSTAIHFPDKDGNVVEGNFIGTSVAGLTDLGNRMGVLIDDASGTALVGNRVGTDADGICDPAERNLISGNFWGIQLHHQPNVIPPIYNVIAGNFIGTDRTGTVTDPDGIAGNGDELGNEYGVRIPTGSFNLVGGTTPAARNIISGNTAYGVNIQGTGNADNSTVGNAVQGNFIGTDVTGTFALPNNAGVSAGGVNTLIGGTVPGARNIISGNGSGVGLGAFESYVYGNYIGTDVTGTLPLGNGHPAANLFFTSAFNGVAVNGIGNKIGGVNPGEANIIANSSGAGVMILSSVFNVPSYGHTIRGNSIYNNGHLGIDLALNQTGARGVTANDLGDPDTGPNDRQNFPLLSSTASFGSGTVISGSLNSTANTTFTLDFYSNIAGDPLFANGEGQTYLGSAQVTTDAAGNVNFNALVAGNAPIGHIVTATATNPAGSTSEFSGKRTAAAYVPATISGLKFNDLNADGDQDVGEPGLPNWTITLDVNADGTVDDSRITDSNGQYSFTSLQPNLYRIREVQQPGWLQTTVNPADITVDASGLSFTGIDFGNRLEDSPGATISGMKFNDEDADGVRDPGEFGLAYWSIFLDSNGSGVHELGEPLTTTNLLGDYSFTNLDPGTYRVREVQEPGWVQTTANPADIVVSGAGQTILSVDFGNDRDPTVTLITGTKFNDADGDGVRDPGEASLGYWPIFLDANSNDAYDIGEPLTFTNIGGNYAFAGLPEGTYRIRELQRPGWTQTTANPADVVVATIGQTIVGIDFGNTRDDVTIITGRKYFDTNTDGILDPGEPDLAWWPIFIDMNSSGSYEAGEPLTYTDWNGGYSFVGLPPGTYRVREAQFSGWTQTSVNPDNIVITANGQTFEGVDFGNHRPDPTIISGQKFEDLNENGIKDSGDPGVHYWPIYIDANANDAYDAGEQYTITNWHGNYSFVGTATGTYRIREVPRSGWRQTTSNPADVVVTSTGQIFADRDFGNFRLARIVGAKYEDSNANGMPDPTEHGLQGWTIYLDANGNDTLDAGEMQTTTGIFGGYSFNNLESDTYRVREVQQPGWTNTSIDQDITVVPNVSSQVYTANIGNFRNGTIDGGIKFHDVNRNGQQDPGELGLLGWTIFLDADGDDTLDVGEVSTITNINGGYSFGDLPPGAYHIREVQQSGWVQTTGPIDVAINSSGQSLAGGSIGNFALARISGAKFEDGNANGILDSGEHGLEGWTIYVDGNQNAALDDGEARTTTSRFGAYSFDGLEAGTYYVREIQQPGWTQTTPVSVEVTVAPNVSAQVHRVDVGNFRNGTVGGFKFHDIDRDGVRDADEPGLEHWTIYLDANSNDHFDAGEPYSITGANGSYSFGDVGPGTHRVREVQETNWVQTTPNLDVTLSTSGQSVTGDIGNFRLARIQGVKFEDTNANGVREAGEIGLENWTIYLDADNNGSLDAGEAQTLTNAAGTYSFDGLEAGAYYVREIQQFGWTQTTPASVAVTVVENVSAQVYTVNVGNFKNGLIEGIKFHDINRNGVQDVGEPGLEGWTIFLDANSDTTLDGGETHTVSNSNGVYTFSNLGPGTYHVREVQQPGWVQTTPDIDLDVTTSGQVQGGGKIGNFRLARIHGVKFEDTNANGVLDFGEHGLENWNIYLDANNNGALDNSEAQTFTNAFGAYSFDNLEAGTHYVREVQQSGWTATSPNPVVVTVVPNLSAQSHLANFGNFRNGSIENGIKFHDINRNSAQDPGEPGLAGWTIFLDTDGDNILDAGEVSTVTDSNGNYSFTNLGPGTYHVREVQQQNWVQTTADFDLAVTTSGQVLDGGKIGNYRLAQINGVKFLDDDSDGQRDTNEIGLPGWTIFLDSNGNGSLDNGEASRLTNSAGAYSFDGLDAGVYRVREVQQPGWVQTTSNRDVIVAANLGSQAVQVDVGNVDETPGKITGGGSIDERVRNFGFIVQPKVRDGVTTFTGSLQYHDKALGINLHSASIDYIGIRPDRIRGRFTGTATINGVAGYHFEVRVEDRAEPGARIDVFRITITGPGGFHYDSNDYASQNGLLDRGGNIQIHKSAQSAGSSPQGASAFLAPAPGSGTDLYVYGTSGADSIVINAGPSAGSITVSVNGASIGTYSGFQNINVYGGEENDVLRVNPSAGTFQSRLFGGAGNDQLYGGTSNNVLVGGDGDDLLVGNAGRDIMIGGAGKDTLLADKESDILIGGDYLFADDLVALETLMAVWATTQPYQTRVSALQYGYGSVGAYRLDASTVLNDFEKDSLTGAQQTDWFLAFDDDTSDAQGNEIT